ncbi:hypothetical protein HPB52_009568 [Rhipicephalus sanguineus]|uniref:Uncharacterized protein n=1 Tax=Rhipicephalus sanguineus TaxID=34632 RepID=A0A9D4T7N3_RHISA|nr:hypothetical protein HPB52_009568 [Rhipicephalus sanguineus]
MFMGWHDWRQLEESLPHTGCPTVSHVKQELQARSHLACHMRGPLYLRRQWHALDGSEGGNLHSGLADVGAVVPGDRSGLQSECCNLFFATDSEESFDGFESD